MGKSGGGSGGGSSGRISYPTYMQDMQHQWLDDWADDSGSSPFDPDEFPNVAVAMKNATSAIGGNPYTGAVAYSPDVDMDNAQGALDDFNVDLASGWTSFLTSAMAGIDATDASPVDFDGMLNVASDRVRRDQNQELSRLNGSVLLLGSAQNSTYLTALTQQEDRTRDLIYDFVSSQEEKVLNTRNLLLGQLGSYRLDGMRARAAQQALVSKMTVSDKADEFITNQKIEIEEATWDLHLFQYGNNVLASITGATTKPDIQTASDLQAGVSGAATGAATGLMIGGPWGAVIGAVIGAVGGVALNE